MLHIGALVRAVGPLAAVLVACHDVDAPGPAPAEVAFPLVAPPEFTVFETGQVRPLAIAGNRLFAVNTPDSRLEVFQIAGSGLQHIVSVPVGLEPIAVAARSPNEVWVVNHLSDSVSIVAVDGAASRVVRTLLVGDEPRDIVFAGPNRSRAFITTAHRGQNAPFDPQLTTPGIGRADVWVFDADTPGGSLGGDPLAILTLFTDTPRALAVSPDGTRVYAAGFHTGNQTTVVLGAAILPGTYPLPLTNHELRLAPPQTALIVRWNGEHWVDENGTAHDSGVKFDLPDKDVFVIDAVTTPPRVLDGADGFYAHVGTVLFNMIVNPANGKVYVSNLEANNAKRFEGPGDFAGHTIRGHLMESRISVLDAGTVAPRHLNKHIDYGACCAPIPNDENARSLAFPMDMAVSADGATLYVVAFGSSKVGVYDTAVLEDDTFVPDAADHIAVSGGGPSGLALDETEGRLYVLTRFDNAISIIDTASRQEIAHVPMFNPEPAHVVAGRPFLYDAALSSSHGDSACASCHVFGDFDSLAWDLGNPDGNVAADPNPFSNPPVQPREFHPMKGPMTTQSLRGMDNHGPMHWRGDRTGGLDAPTEQPDGGSFDEFAAFMKFQPAFAGLLGRDVPISEAEMEAFTAFILELSYPPNPIRNLDNSLTAAQRRGKDKFMNELSTLPQVGQQSLTCNFCHRLDRSANAEFDVPKPGFFGSDGKSCAIFVLPHTKTPHLRNQYQKVGMFGNPVVPGVLPGNNDHKGDQVRGFGFFHDGTADTVFRFLSAIAFQQVPLVNPGGFPLGGAGNAQRRDMEQFMLAFDSNLYPLVGQQVTLTGTNGAVAGPRIDLLLARANAHECELVARRSAKEGYLYTGAGWFSKSELGAPQVSDAALRASAGAGPLTYTCTPPGSGHRMGLDRDLDGVFDGDE